MEVVQQLLLVVQHPLQDPVQHPVWQLGQPLYHLEQLHVLLERYLQMQRNLPNRYSQLQAWHTQLQQFAWVLGMLIAF